MSSKPTRTLSAATVFAAVAVFTFSAEARPQANVGLTLGVAELGHRGDPFERLHFSLGGRGDVLVFRERNADWGVGPYAEALTTSFEDLQLGAGLSALVPVHDYLPIVVSGGAYGRHSDLGWEPGVAASVFWGSRSYNYHASYGLAAGVLLQGRYGLGDSRETALILAGQVDLALLGLPFLLAYEAVRPR